MSKKYDNLGERIKKLRILKKFSQEELGKVLNMPKQSVSRIEKSNRSVTDIEVKKIADFFEVPERYLLEEGWIEKKYKLPYYLRNKWKINVPKTIDDYIMETESQIDFLIDSEQISFLRSVEEDIKNSIKALKLLLKESKEKVR
jgi:transcriptional regulator with XRE-family HTH domain